MNVAQAFNIYVAWAKLFKYLSFNKTMSQLNGTLSATAADLSGFLVMFVIIYMAFVQLGYLLFGIQVNFSSWLCNILRAGRELNCLVIDLRIQ